MVHVREVERMKPIAVAVGQALGRPVSVSTLERMTRGAHPIPLGWRGNGWRVLRYDAAFLAWVTWWKNAPRRGRRRQLALSMTP
jgi:hypothetical protein